MAEDRLARHERETILDHAADCDDCRHALLVLGVRARAAVRVRPRSWIPWAVAAAFVVAIVGLLALRGRPEPTPEAPVAEVPEEPEPPPPEPPKPGPVPAPRLEVPEPIPPPEPPKPEPKPEAPAKPEEKPPAPPPEPEKPAPQKPPVPPRVRPPTRAVVAVLDRAEGQVFVLGAAGRIAVKAGQSLRPGDGLECAGAAALAQLTFPDKTRLEAAGDTLIREISDAKGKRIRVEKGVVSAEVAGQPEGMPLVFTTPHGEAKVVGTRLRLHVDPDPRKGTRLEVAEGKVELRNAAGRTTMVSAGRQAVAATGVALASKAAPREEVLYSLDFEDGRLPPGDFTGTVQRGPQNRLCLAGLDTQGTCKVFIGPPAGLFHFQGDEVLSFDYWVDGSADQVNLNVWNRTAKLTHEAVVPKHVLGKWARATFRLADMGAPGVRLKEGDLVANLYVQGTGGPPSRRFYIDNLQFTRPWAIKLR